MFQGAFSLLRCAQSPGAHVRARTRLNNARDIRHDLDFASLTPTRINAPPAQNKMKNHQFKDYFTPAGRERKKPERVCTRACMNT
jgi:hypothetical protein